MSNITVFVFLLESVPGFENTLKSTLQSISGKYNDDSFFTKCNPYMVDFIWKSVNENRDLITQGNHLPILYHSTVANDFNKFYPVKLQNSLENNYIENEFIDYEQNNNQYYFMKNNKVNKISTKSEGFLNNAPFLVAIFETITNITAQTCGGTLLSSHWVLTAATCLDLLPSLYNDITKQNIHKSHYTIIANGKNPLVDGTVHNVTEIILHPKYNLTTKKNLKAIDSQVALMKIEPIANGYVLPIFKGNIKQGISVRVYGWTLQKNSSGEYMGVTSILAKIINSNKCKSNYKYINKSSLICLSADNNNNVNFSEMSSGGPVLVYSKGTVQILAVAQIDTSSRITAYTLTNYDWIDDIVNK